MFSPAYKRYAIVAMTALYTFVLVDRGLIAMLLQPIKEELQLSDTQLGFITGIAFSALYAAMAIPMARWADRGNRALISAIATGLLGLAATACLFITSFVHLMLVRIGAAIGEVGCRPAAYSLMGDYFPTPVERTRAMYVYDAAGPLSALLSYSLAGWLNELYGWRLTFLLVGIPCAILAVVFKYTIVEPREGHSHVQSLRHQAPPLREVLAALWSQRSCRHITIAFVLIFIMSSGLGPWTAAFMIRSHGIGTAELGLWMGAITIAGATAGLLIGGYVVGRRFGNDERGQLRMCSMTIALAVPFFVAYLTVPNKYLALSAQLPQLLLINSFLPAAFAIIQRLVPDNMRATILTVVMTLANLIGMGIGPQLVGIVSDQLTPALGVHALRYAMLIVSLVVLWAAYHLWLASQTVQQDLLRMTQWTIAEVPGRQIVPWSSGHAAGR